MNRQHGFGLPEILISLLLGCFIINTLINHYLSAKQQYNRAENDLEQATELQLVTDLLRDSIRRAGFTPCLNISDLRTRDARNNNERLVGLAVEESAVQVNRMSEIFDSIPLIINSTKLLTSKNQSIKVKHPLLIADCYHGEVNTVTKITNSSRGRIVTLKYPLSFSYQSPTYLGEWVEEKFFIRANFGKASSLFYRQNNTDELTANIHEMKISVKKPAKHDLVKIILGLDKDRKWPIDTAVRGG